MGLRRRTAVAGAAAVALTGCGSSLASAPALQHTVSTSWHLAVARRGAAIDRLAVIARRRYSEEVHGAAVHKQLRRVAADPVLLHALRAHDLGGLRAEVRLQDATPHAHISRQRVVRGSRVLADAGGFGLGLAIGRQLAEQMNGGLRLLDTMSGGCFVLPLESAIDP